MSKTAEPTETRVLEVRRTVKKVVDEVVSSEKIIFELREGEWTLNTPSSSSWTIQQLEDALVQLKKLKENNGE